jgi:methionyl aminopeptidase
MATALTDTLANLDLERPTTGKPTVEDGVPSSGAASDAGGSDAEVDDDPSPDAGSAKKKKKKKPKKKKAAAGVPLVQSEPPRVGLSKIFLDGVFPVGEEEEYGGE